MKMRLLRALGSNWAQRESEKQARHLQHGILSRLSVFGSILIVWFLAAACAFGQTAQISGVITDSSGAVVPKASTTALNRDTGISRTSESNHDGYYTVPLLQPGNYMITVKASGFTTQVLQG